MLVYNKYVQRENWKVFNIWQEFSHHALYTYMKRGKSWWNSACCTCSTHAKVEKSTPLHILHARINNIDTWETAEVILRLRGRFKSARNIARCIQSHVSLPVERYRFCSARKMHVYYKIITRKFGGSESELKTISKTIIIIIIITRVITRYPQLVLIFY